MHVDFSTKKWSKQSTTVHGSSSAEYYNVLTWITLTL